MYIVHKNPYTYIHLFSKRNSLPTEASHLTTRPGMNQQSHNKNGTNYNNNNNLHGGQWSQWNTTGQGFNIFNIYIPWGYSGCHNYEAPLPSFPQS